MTMINSTSCLSHVHSLYGVISPQNGKRLPSGLSVSNSSKFIDTGFPRYSWMHTPTSRPRGTPLVLLFMRYRDLSNPIRYPRFHASASGTRQCTAFAFGIPHNINGFHPYTVSSMHLSRPQVVPFLSRFRG
jgi:hypothetical protein